MHGLIFLQLQKFAQQQAVITRQRVGFYMVDSVLDASNPYVSPNMVNRSFFVMADVTTDVAHQQNFLTQVQTLPGGMMFDFAGSSLRTLTLTDNNTGVPLFTARYFRFAPSGAVFQNDADLVANRRFDVVITEGLAGPGDTYTKKTSGNVIKYTNSVNVFTGRVYKP